MTQTAYQNIYDALTGLPLVKQVTVAVLGAALGIVGEAPTTTNHAERLAWATAMRAQRQRLDFEVGGMLTRVISDVRIYGNLAAYTDADVQAVVNGLVAEAVGAA